MAPAPLAACTGILETCITCMLQTSLVHYLQIIIQFCHFLSFSSFLFFLSFFLLTFFFFETFKFYPPFFFWQTQKFSGPTVRYIMQPCLTIKCALLLLSSEPDNFIHQGESLVNPLSSNAPYFIILLCLICQIILLVNLPMFTMLYTNGNFVLLRQIKNTKEYYFFHYVAWPYF